MPYVGFYRADEQGQAWTHQVKTEAGVGLRVRLASTVEPTHISCNKHSESEPNANATIRSMYSYEHLLSHPFRGGRIKQLLGDR